MARSFKISFIGSGNLASNLAPYLENAGHIINSISSLHLHSAEILADSLYNTRAIDDNDFSSEDTEIILLTAKDDNLKDIVKDIKAPEGAHLVHCSGFAHIDVLSDFPGSTGVFYPLQSFSKGRRAEFKNIPICVESFDELLSDKLTILARSISKNVSFVSSEKRKQLHLAAVFANNFVNHMLSISDDILVNSNLSISLLQPLVIETLNKAFEMGPYESQTGPAKRGDMETIQEHLKLLQAHPEIAEIYELISRQIMDAGKGKN